jgi:hypothetical protein
VPPDAAAVAALATSSLDVCGRVHRDWYAHP